MADDHDNKDAPWLDIHESRCDDGMVQLVLAGELDLASGQAVRTRLGAYQRAHATVTLDLSELTFIDCAGLQVLVEAFDVAASDGTNLRISGHLQEPVRRLIELIDAAGLSTPTIAALGRGDNA